MQIAAGLGRCFVEKRSAIKAPVFVSGFAPDIAMHNGPPCRALLTVSGRFALAPGRGQSSGRAVSSL